jgi:hypothetical protein
VGVFRGTARTAVRKAERSGLDIEVDRSGRLLPVFCDLYEKCIQRWAGMCPRAVVAHALADDAGRFPTHAGVGR